MSQTESLRVHVMCGDRQEVDPGHAAAALAHTHTHARVILNRDNFWCNNNHQIPQRNCDRIIEAQG